MKYDLSLKDKILEFINENPDKINQKDIANYLGVSKNELKGFLSYCGISLLKEKRRILSELREAGLKNKEIAEIMGFNTLHAVTNMARRSGLKRKKKPKTKLYKSKILRCMEKANYNLTKMEKICKAHKSRIKEFLIKHGLIDIMYEHGFKERELDVNKKDIIVKFLKKDSNMDIRKIYEKISKVYGEGFINIRYISKVKSLYNKGKIWEEER